jgi:hypothetical protein
MIRILIALSLEGLREVIRDHKVVREARENILLELKLDQGQLAQELPAVKKASQDVKDLVADLPNVAQPELLNKRLAGLRNPDYFFKFHSWQTALSSGALGHMETEEVAQYSAAEFGINELQQLASGGAQRAGSCPRLLFDAPESNARGVVRGR